MFLASTVAAAPTVLDVSPRLADAISRSFMHHDSHSRRPVSDGTSNPEIDRHDTRISRYVGTSLPELQRKCG